MCETPQEPGRFPNHQPPQVLVERSGLYGYGPKKQEQPKETEKKNDK